MAYACIYGYINNIVGTCQALVQRESFRFLSLLVKQLGPWIGCVLRGNHEVHQANKALKQSRGALVGLAPTNKAPSPSNWNMKHYKLVEFLSNLNVKPPLHECKALPRTNVKSPLLTTFWRRLCPEATSVCFFVLLVNFFTTVADLLQGTIAFVLKIFSFSDRKKLLGDAFDRYCWAAACCSTHLSNWWHAKLKF